MKKIAKRFLGRIAICVALGIANVVRLIVRKDWQMRFEWDEEKEQINIQKHHINFDLALKVFGDPFRLEIFDEFHSVEEDRYKTIGEINETFFVVTVIYTERGTKIRIISARKATKQEKEVYYDHRKRSST